MTKIDEIKFKEGGSISFKDDVITIVVPRKNILEFAQEVYDEYFSSENDKIETFGNYLIKELEKETNGSAR